MSYKSWGITGDFRFDATLTAMAVSSSASLSVVLWVKRTAAEWNAGGALYTMIYAQDMTSSDQQIRMYCGDDLAVAVARTTTNNQNSSMDFGVGDPDGYDDIWVPLFWIGNSNVSRYSYVEDSSNKGTHSTTDRSLSALDEFRIGKYNDTGSGPFTGKIAEVSLWDAALAESEMDLFCPTSKGETGPAAPTISTATSGANCVGYWPLDYDSDTQTDESGTANGSLIATGTRVYDSDHPTITSSGIILPASTYYAQHQ